MPAATASVTYTRATAAQVATVPFPSGGPRYLTAGGASHPLLRRVMCPGTPRRRLRSDPERASRRVNW
jgi:hypothetical protein